MRSPAGSGFEAWRVTRPSRRGTVTTLAPSAAAPRSRTNAASAWTAEGSFVFGPKGIPHTFIVSSEEARFLLVTELSGFEQFMRAAGEPAARLEIPPPRDRASRCRRPHQGRRRIRHRDHRPPGHPGLAPSKCGVRLEAQAALRNRLLSSGTDPPCRQSRGGPIGSDRL
jgi:hypothetical protein